MAETILLYDGELPAYEAKHLDVQSLAAKVREVKQRVMDEVFRHARECTSIELVELRVRPEPAYDLVHAGLIVPGALRAEVERASAIRAPSGTKLALGSGSTRTTTRATT